MVILTVLSCSTKQERTEEETISVTMERITGQPVAIPDRLAAFMQGTKQSVPVTKDFADFKAYLLGQ